MSGAMPSSGQSGMGRRQQRAAEVQAELEAKKRQQAAGTSQDQEAGEAGGDASTESQPASARPIGEGEYEVRPGDCMSSIAAQSGHFWETIWNDPANEGLRDAGRDPNVLLPGDRITIPPLEPKQEPGESEMLHRFVRLGEPTKLRLQILDDDQPVANQPWELQVDGKTYSGTTDPQGKLEVDIRGSAGRASLVVGTEENGQYLYDLDLGDMDPVESIRGVQKRLQNLGFHCPDHGQLDEETQQAILAFQKRYELPETGQPDERTRTTLKEKHGC